MVKMLLGSLRETSVRERERRREGRTDVFNTTSQIVPFLMGVAQETQ